MNEVHDAVMASLARLTDFQRATVDALMARRSDGSPPAPRRLVADEVGLGKTVVARGLIASLLLQRLDGPAEARGKPLRVTYICSNRALAEENCRKLSIFPKEIAHRYVQTPSYDRLAEVAVELVAPAAGKLLELASLTPATSFTLSHGDGNARERYLIFRALARHPELEPVTAALGAFFSKGVQSWPSLDAGFARFRFVGEILASFHSALEAAPVLGADHKERATRAGIGCGSWLTLLAGADRLREQDSALQTHVRTALRIVFVRCCANNLSADLFILDEFQRFRDLIAISQPDNEQSLIANQVFTRHHQGHILLLSATPFKALTHIDDEGEHDAHLSEFRLLLQFLTHGAPLSTQRYEAARTQLLTQILRLREPDVGIRELDPAPRQLVEAELRPLICRTERSQISPDVHGLIRASHQECDSALSEGEIANYIAMDQLGAALQAVDRSAVVHHLLDFHKLAPWALSFLTGYKFRQQLDKYRDAPTIIAARERSRAAWLPHKQFAAHKIDLRKSAPHSKFRALAATVFGSGGEKMLWMPPSRPYYAHAGAFAGQTEFTKTLLFSEMAIAPRALSGLLSYQAEYLLLKGRRTSPGSLPRRPIRFEGHGLAPWALIYPAKALASFTLVPGSAPLASVIAHVTSALAPRIAALRRRITASRPNDKRWYALAPFLLDADLLAADGQADPYLRDWLDMGDVTSSIESDDSGRTSQHESLAALLRDDALALGEMPADLADYLATLAVAGPGVCLYRTLSATWSGHMGDHPALATRGAHAIVTLFNKQEAQMVLAQCALQGPVWRQALAYCAHGNLQAMLDEYAHLLAADHSHVEAVAKLASVMTLRTVPVTAQTCDHDEVHFRWHYAAMLGNQKAGDDKGVARVGHLRDAFNSPFWPFSLNSTSIGQEGLDFHWYCSRVVHWSLPSNPIDLEQREGRVNRYKSLVVRRRLAETYAEAFAPQLAPGENYWQQLFSYADKATRGQRGSDLVPYWHIPQGAAYIERVVPMLPMSRESSRLDEILRILSLYRLAFGQPRQQELLEFLLKRADLADAGELAALEKTLLIDLAPINYLPRRPHKDG